MFVRMSADTNYYRIACMHVATLVTNILACCLLVQINRPNKKNARLH
jgi:hypothetical protein